MKKILSLICALLVAATTLTAQTTWDCGDPSVNGGADVTAKLHNDTLTISGSGAMADYPAMNGLTTALWRSYSSSIRTLIIDDGVTTIGEDAFFGCSGLASVTIPSSVYLISRSFYNCIGLKNLAIADGINTLTVEGYSFYNCAIDTVYMGRNVSGNGNFGEGVKRLTIGSSVTSIGSDAFTHCSGLTSITIPSSVTEIGRNAFSQCTALKNLAIADGIDTLTVDVNNGGAFYNCAIDTVYMGRNVYYENNNFALFGNGVKRLTIGSSVTSIGDMAFYNCSGLTSVTIPSSVTEIGRNAFFNCTALKNLAIADGINTLTVVDNSFSGCVIDTIYMGRNVYYENNYYLALFGTGVKRLTVGSSVTSIGSYAFFQCTALKNLAIADGSNPLTVDNSANSGSFRGCVIDTVYMGRSVSGNTATLALFGTGVKRLTVGSSVTTIGSYAFYNCSGLISVTSLSLTPPAVQPNTFQGVNSACCLYVPLVARTTYQNANYWKNFSYISTIYIVTFNPQGGTAVASQGIDYGLKASEPAAPTRTGYTFSGWYREAGCVNKWSFNTDIVTQDTTLFAKWTINTYTVAFDPQGGTAVTSQGIDYGFKASEPAAPTLTGYTFSGWYREAGCVNEWSFNTDIVTQDTTLFAKWTINTYTVAFNPQGGTAVTSQGVDYGFTASEPTEPTHTGYTFIGWYREAGCTNKWNFCTDAVTQDTTLFARWTIDLSVLLDSVTALNDTISTLQNENSTLADSISTLQNENGTLRDSISILLNENNTVRDTVTLTDTVTIIQTDTVTVTVRDTVIQIRVDTVVVVRVDTVYITMPSKPTATAKVEQAKISVYPNPVTNGQLIVDNGQWKAGEAIEVYSMSGALVATYTVTGEKTSLNISHLPNGTYLLKVGGYTAKFVKQ